MLSKRAESLIPYIAGEQPQGGFIKLNTNENPYPPSDAVSAVLKEFDPSVLRLYPDPDCRKLSESIAAYEGVLPENIFLGNGSDEVLGFAFLALFERSVAFCDVTYSFYPVYCDLHGLDQHIVPLRDDFTMDIQEFSALKNIGGIVIANPNAPTSIGHNSDEIAALAKQVSCNILVDEAYIDFAVKAKSLARIAAAAPNLLVVKTFSKSYSLAGLRCGYAVGSRELIAGLNRVKNCFNSYTLGAIVQRAALAAVSDRTYFNECVQQLNATRDTTILKLRQAGHTVFCSDANFIFVRHQSLTGAEVYRRLKEQGILVRHFSAPRTAPFVRVTVGTPSDTERFFDAYCAL